MTAEQHQAAARQEDKEARKEAAAAYTDAPGTNPLNAGIEPELYLYPQATSLGQDQMARAQRLEQHAREHEQAAAELQHFEDAECKAVPGAERGACPLLGPVSGLADIDGGVRVRFGDPNRVATLLPRMRCHNAYARAHGFANTPDCALYIPGVEFRQAPEPQAIDIVGGDPKTAAEIRRRVRSTAMEQQGR